MKSLPQRFQVAGSHRILCAGGCLAALWAGQAQCAEVNDDWTRNFRLGAQLLFNVKANFTLNGPITVNRQSPGPVGVPGQNHYYDDGYVLVDNTGNAGGDTSYWGYTYASQIDSTDPQNPQLVMKSVRAYEASEQYSDSAGVSPGLDVAYGSQIRDWNSVRIGWEAGYQFTPFTFKDPTTLNTVFLRDVQAFNLGGIAVPPAPYSGGPSGIGPSIPDIAYRRNDEIVPGTITGARELDVNLHALRAGATVFWRFQPRWALTGSLGPAMGLVPGSYTYNETFTFNDGTTAGESGDMSHTEVVFGGYVSAVLHYRVVSSADIYLGGQFMGLTSAEFGNSQREASLDLGATFALSLGVNWPF